MSTEFKNIHDFPVTEEQLRKADPTILKSFVEDAQKVIDLSKGKKSREVKRRVKWLGNYIDDDGGLVDNDLTNLQLEHATQGLRDLKRLVEDRRKGK